MPSTRSSSARPSSHPAPERRADKPSYPHHVHAQSGRCHPQPGQSVTVRVQEIADGLRNLRGLPTGPRVCGRLRCAETVGLSVVTDGKSKRASLDGVVRCGSSSACVSCAWSLRYHQRRELEALVALWTAQGGTLALATFTIRHWRGLTLDKSSKGVRAAWRALTKGKPWVRLTERLGAAHVLRALDVTHGAGGWHVHVHAIVFLRPGATPTAELIAKLFDRWSVQVRKSKSLGAACVPAAEGLDWRQVESAGYLAKMEVGEVAADAASRSPWQIAAGAAAGVAEDVALWTEWVQAMKGVPSLPTPRQLAPFLAGIRAEHARVAGAQRAGQGALAADATPVSGSGDVMPDSLAVVGAAPADGRLSDRSSANEPRPLSRTITRTLIATFPPPVWDSLVRVRGAVADLLRRAVRGGLPDVAAGTALHLFGKAEDGAPDPRAVAWVLRVITPEGPAVVTSKTSGRVARSADREAGGE